MRRVVSSLPDRVRARGTAALGSICEAIEPWPHGTVARTSRYPDYFDYNVVRVCGRPPIGADELATFADAALDGRKHRRIDFDFIDAAEPLRAGLQARGFKTLRLLWMHHEAESPPEADERVRIVPYDDVDGLRQAWNREDFPDV